MDNKGYACRGLISVKLGPAGKLLVSDLVFQEL